MVAALRVSGGSTPSLRGSQASASNGKGGIEGVRVHHGLGVLAAVPCSVLSRNILDDIHAFMVGVDDRDVGTFHISFRSRFPMAKVSAICNLR